MGLALTARERFARIAAPSLVMVGEQTFPGMLETAEKLVGALPGATLRVMPGAMHEWEPAPMAAAIAGLARA